jgi:hypothetical protein
MIGGRDIALVTVAVMVIVLIALLLNALYG